MSASSKEFHMTRTTVSLTLVLALSSGLFLAGAGGGICLAQWLDNGVTAHRGNSGEFPENTLPAFQSGIELGADWLELDVYRTLDDQIVVIHDSTTGRVADANLSVTSSTYAELAALDVAYQFRISHNLTLEECPKGTIPLLSDVLALMTIQDRTRVSIQPKMDCVTDIVNVVNQSQAAPWVGFNDGSLTYMSQALNLLPDTTIFWDRSGSDINADIATATTQGFSSIVMYQSDVTQYRVDAIHAAGLQAGAWTVDRPQHHGKPPGHGHRPHLYRLSPHAAADSKRPASAGRCQRGWNSRRYRRNANGRQLVVRGRRNLVHG